MRKVEHAIGDGFCVILIGAGVGWFVGLSVSPTVQAVITAILATVSGIVGALSGIQPPQAEDDQPQKHPRISPVPAALLFVGLVPGSVLGMMGRTHQWFGADPRPMVERWRTTGLSEEDLANRLFDQVCPPGSDTRGKGSQSALSSDPKELVAQWTRLGLSKTAVAQRLFDQAYPPVAASSQGAGSGGAGGAGKPEPTPHPIQAALGGGLYAGKGDEVIAQLRKATKAREVRDIWANTQDDQVMDVTRALVASASGR